MTTTIFPGAYKVPEAARYLYVTTRLDLRKPTPRDLIRWMRLGLASQHLINAPGRELLIDFEDLVSMRIISFLHGIGISTDKIRKAKEYLERLTGNAHPFATEDLWTENTDIFAEVGKFLITASRSGQLPFGKLVRQHLVNVHDLTFSRRVASSWTPSSGILLKPGIQFGAPCIAKTGIPTYAVWRMFMGGDSIGFISRSYSLEESQIEHAIDWENQLAQVTFTRTA
ncbi:MAG: DUF433 domain-containing protein [Dehalococcoidia bacterium]|nr:DUF433 domain-containing protein [Dehalococcoidia bacterium]